MDAIELLQHDHRMVEQLFADYQSAASDSQRRGVVEIMVRELSKHAALEELMVYPLAKDVLPDGEQAVNERLAEHMDVKKTLVELDGLEPGDERTDRLMRELETEVSQHIRSDEGSLLPKLSEALDQSALDELGQALDDAKKLAPTRAHPGAPDEPPSLALGAPVLAIYDRVRDRIQGRPRT
ncbi:hemerythrin domain-containing protein [Skermania sp. ID1734]|uniref:hemerythrin domain-containing protein n=1 Tax=Skermania sp. ID1734 TaxID=2597516 RepID=UPI00117D5853|nr:hemerythrin domain-containing protein [Skermania sp. ID1734]TSE00946.1 hemerythrin domain-containing protein [Skermania sp. ID1734]